MYKFIEKRESVASGQGHVTQVSSSISLNT